MNAHEILGRLLNDPRVKVTLSIDELISCGEALRALQADLKAKLDKIDAQEKKIQELEDRVKALEA